MLHGDLTTSNIMISKEGINIENSLYLIDFGLSYKSTVIEDKAVDLYVLEKAFICSHPKLEDKFQLILDGYKETASKSDLVIKRLNKGKSHNLRIFVTFFSQRERQKENRFRLKIAFLSKIE